MKRIICVCLFICLMVGLSGCSINPNNMTDTETETSNDVVEKNTTIMKDVVFLNLLQARVLNDGYEDGSVLWKMQYGLSYHYSYNEETDKDTLYAFHLYLYPSENDIDAEEIMKAEGMYIVKDYPKEVEEYGCVFACTMDRLVEVFDSEDSLMNGIMYEIQPAPRPDILEVFRDIGWTEEIEKSPYDWYRMKQAYVQSKIGEETQITLSVPVIVSNPE